MAVWDWDRTSRNDFMGAMSFSLADIWEAPGRKMSGWFKLLDQKMGEFVHCPILDTEDSAVSDLRAKFDGMGGKTVPQDNAPDDEPGKPAAPVSVNASDFVFLKVLGKGSFGKVRDGAPWVVG